jgi:anti-sigma regulatory factor (Ser/Thr protein kinase)
MKSLTVPGTLDSLEAIADYVMDNAVEAGLNKKASYKLRLAVDEIVTNIILYGYEEANLQGVLDLHTTIDSQTLTILVEDTGQSFDPSEKLPEELEKIEQSIEKRSIGGLGIYLAFQGVDDFKYERVGDRNRNIFVVNRTEPEKKEI